MSRERVSLQDVAHQLKVVVHPGDNVKVIESIGMLINQIDALKFSTKALIAMLIITVAVVSATA